MENLNKEVIRGQKGREENEHGLVEGAGEWQEQGVASVMTNTVGRHQGGLSLLDMVRRRLTILVK